MNKQLSQSSVFLELLASNNNPSGYKQVIAHLVKGIQTKTFMYFTSEQADFLNHVYQTQINKQVLKKRIRKITDQKMDQLMDQIISGKIKKVNETSNLEYEELQVKIGEIMLEKQSQSQKSLKGIEKVKQIQEQYKQFKQKMQIKKQIIHSRKAQKIALQQQFKKSIEQQKRQQQRKIIKQHLQKIKQKQQQRKASNEKFKQFLKQYRKVKPLHQILAQSYKQKIQLPILQQSKRKLQAISHKKKPTLQQINDHQLKYLQSKNNRPQKSVLINQTIDVGYKSHFYQQQQQRYRASLQVQQSYSSAWDQIEKQKRYSQFVKQKVKPKISQALKISLQQERAKSNSHKVSPDRSRIIQVGKSYLQYMRNLQKVKKQTKQQIKDVTKQSRYINYLDDLKAKSQRGQKGSYTSFDWQRDMQNRTSSKLQKRQRVLMKSKQLQQKAKRDEKLVSHYSYGRAEDIIAKKKQIDDTLLSSIKAKVAILKDSRD